MSKPQFNRWVAFFNTNPFGPAHEDFRFAVLTGLLGRILKSWSKDAKVPALDVLYPSQKRTRRRQTAAEMMGMLRANADTVIDPRTE